MIEPGYGQDVTFSGMFDQLLQLGAIEFGVGELFFEQPFASSLGEVLALTVEVLILGRNPCMPQVLGGARGLRKSPTDGVKTPCRNGNKHLSGEITSLYDMVLRTIRTYRNYHARRSLGFEFSHGLPKFRTICPPATCPISSGNAVLVLPPLPLRTNWRGISTWIAVIERSPTDGAAPTIVSASPSC